jgi:hypothetical protein
MRVAHNGLKFVVDNSLQKIITAGEYVTEDAVEIELLTALSVADAVQVLPN